MLFVSHLRNISISKPTNMFSYFFLSRKFIVLLLTLRSVINFELLFVYGVRYELRFFLFLFCFEYSHRIVTTFIENITLYWVALTPLLKNQLKNICVGQDSTVHSYFIKSFPKTIIQHFICRRYTYRELCEPWLLILISGSQTCIVH